MNRAEPLRRSDLDPDPLRQFRAWLEAAERAGVPQPERMALATATPDGRPSARMVLLKAADAQGFAFHTNYESRKGRELTANSSAALLFYWHELGRQVRVEGRVERVPVEESEAYFRTRAPGSRIAAAASAQSDPIDSREELERRYAELEERYRDAEIPRPEHWGGYRVVPEAYEFWQHRDNRLHDRFCYTRAREGTSWNLRRLQP